MLPLPLLALLLLVLILLAFFRPSLSDWVFRLAALGALVSGWLGIRSVLAAGVFLLAAFLLMFRVESSCTGE